MLDGLKNYIARLSKNNFYCSGNFQEELLPGEYIHTYPPPPLKGREEFSQGKKIQEKRERKRKKKGEERKKGGKGRKN